MNQCMGCQAGWEYKYPGYLHRVEGGYPGEVVVCTKHEYQEADEAQRDSPPPLRGD